MTKAMIKQYKELKAKHPDAILLFRCGDFYEAYGEDAAVCSKLLPIKVAKNKGNVRHLNFPHYKLADYLPVIIRAGHRVAICDQLEAPRQKKLVKRGSSEVTNN